jgi:hypothetical protein
MKHPVLWITIWYGKTMSCVVSGKVHNLWKGIPSLKFMQWICWQLHKVSVAINYPTGMQYKNWEDSHTPIFPWAVRFPLNHLTYGCPDCIPQWKDTLWPTTTVEFCGASVRFSLYWSCSVTTSAQSCKSYMLRQQTEEQKSVHFWLFLWRCKYAFVCCCIIRICQTDAATCC